jgi:sirohydrochlorin cobaltochelatase
MKAVLIISHGSRSAKTKEEVRELIAKLKPLTSVALIECAFLELESPLIPQGIELCVSRGATEIIILLNFLNSGRHVDVDIPGIVEESRKKFPAVTITITQPVGQHEGIAKLFADMLEPFSKTP